MTPFYDSNDVLEVFLLKVFYYLMLFDPGNEANLLGDLQWGPVGETRAYDIVLDVAMRAQQFHKRNLRLQGSWIWLLAEFASCYGVKESYTKLR